MGKKNKKSFYKKQLKPMVKGNKVLIAALGGATAGIALANILGTAKSKEILHTVENSISNIMDRISNGFNGVKNDLARAELKGR